MIGQVTGAVARAFLVVLLISTPSLLLPSVSSDTAQVVALAAIFAAALTLFEYSATYPGLIEFRDAPPFNRIRFFAMFLSVFLLSVMAGGDSEPNLMAEFVRAVGVLIGEMLDFPYSPVRLFILMMPNGTRPATIDEIRAAAGLAYLISISSLVVFWVVIRIKRWPLRNGSFNVWVNLPTFDPTAGGDVVDRLNRASRMNVAIGFLLPFLFPALVTVLTLFSDTMALTNPQTLIWTVTAWALLPASLFMRGIAVRRIAQLITEQRRRAAPEEDEELLPA